MNDDMVFYKRLHSDFSKYEYSTLNTLFTYHPSVFLYILHNFSNSFVIPVALFPFLFSSIQFDTGSHYNSNFHYILFIYVSIIRVHYNTTYSNTIILLWEKKLLNLCDAMHERREHAGWKSIFSSIVNQKLHRDTLIVRNLFTISTILI